MYSDRLSAAVPDVPLIPAQTVTLIPYGLARRLRIVAIADTSTEVTVLTARPNDIGSLQEIQALTGLAVVPVEAPETDIDRLLDHMAGHVATDELWLQHRHILALGRLVDHSVNLGQVDTARPLVDRALEFAPYSAELWLMKARLSTRREEVEEALLVASNIAPSDRRISRWMQSLGESEEHSTAREEVQQEAPASEPSVNLVAPVAEDPNRQRSGHQKPDGAALAEESFRAAREISELHDLSSLTKLSAEALKSLSQAHSASAYCRDARGWSGHSTDPQLQARLHEFLPKESSIAAQVVRLGLPVVIADTKSRVEEVGQLVTNAGIHSFALLPVRTDKGVDGLIYLNYENVDAASIVFEPDVSKAIEIVINCAGAALGDLRDTPLRASQARSSSLNDSTDTYTSALLQRLLAAELERARRYRFSVSILALQVQFHEDASEDLVLQAEQRVAEILRSAARASDAIGHSRGNEFIVMLPQTTAKGAGLVAKRMMDALATDSRLAGFGRSEAWIGAATFPDQGADTMTLLATAEGAREKTRKIGAAAEQIIR